MILDAAFLISVDRSERPARAFAAAVARSGTSLHTTHPIVAQVWRNGARQARLTTFLKAITVHPFDDGRLVGHLLARSGTSDVVDAHLVVCASRIGHDILTSDAGDIAHLVAAFGPDAPAVHSWG
ncbi:MAG: hypothetical protein KA129_04655 [Microthrixaceae bacterium]|nr:hypothetical protein [Actinomycetota bacterium]MBP6728891.1 hypothetical protein [Microthrixaceae bacterium]